MSKKIMDEAGVADLVSALADKTICSHQQQMVSLEPLHTSSDSYTDFDAKIY